MPTTKTRKRMGRPPLMEYTGTCGICGRPSAMPRRAVTPRPGQRIEVCMGCAHRWRRRRTFEYVDRRKYPKLQTRVVGLYKSGHSVHELSKTYDLDRSLIYTWLRKEKVKLRGHRKST